MIRNLRNLKEDKSGILLEGLITIVFVISSSIIGLVGALAVNRIADALTPFISNNVQALALVQNCRNAYIVGVVLVDISLIVYWGVSAQRKERQESPMPVYPI
jgi:hypothetical protein